MTILPDGFPFVLLPYMLVVVLLIWIQTRVEENQEAPPSKIWQRAFVICAVALLVGAAILARRTAVKPTDPPTSGKPAFVTTAYFNCVLYGFHVGDVFVESRDAKVGKIMAPLEQDPAGCVEEVQRFKESELVAMTLQGRADATEFTPELAKEYGSNKTLAYRRAETVLNWLASTADKTKKEQLANRTTLLAAGPEYVSGPLDKRLLARDRSVFLRAAWKVPTSEVTVPASTEEGMLSRSDTLALVAAVMALSAYLATVSVFLRERMAERERVLRDKFDKENPKQSNATKEEASLREERFKNGRNLDQAFMKCVHELRLLFLADVPAILSAVTFLLYRFYWNGQRSLQAGSLWLTMALATVMVFHSARWLKSGTSWWKRL